MSGPTCPWDFTEAPQPGGPVVENLPSDDPVIVKAGQDLADVAEQGRRLGEARGFPTLPRCNECAFTAGTVPNRSLLTLGDAVKAVVESTGFYCHKGAEPGTKLCRGYVDAMTKFHGAS